MLKSATTITVSLMATIIGAVVWAVTTFATIDYVDKKHNEVREDLKEIKGMIIDVYKEVKN